MTDDNRVYERLFCCECGAEVPPGIARRALQLDGPGTSARVVPALQPGTGGTEGSPRPHVWCPSCVLQEETVSVGLPRPTTDTPSVNLHRFIWSVGEGRTDAVIRKHWSEHPWGEKLSVLLRELTEAGKIERRGDRRVALCPPWAQPTSRYGEEELNADRYGEEELNADRYGEEELNADRYGEDLRHGFALGPDGHVYVTVALEQRLKNIEVMLATLLELATRVDDDDDDAYTRR